MTKSVNSCVPHLDGGGDLHSVPCKQHVQACLCWPWDAASTAHNALCVAHLASTAVIVMPMMFVCLFADWQ